MRIRNDVGCDECAGQYEEQIVDGVTVFQRVDITPTIEFRIDTQEDYDHCDYGTPCNICKECLEKALKEIAATSC